jgi:alanyl-tRNA synthetase
MAKEEAKESWVEWSFWEKYPDTVKVYTFKDSDNNIYSSELCWWPHVKNTWSMWIFKIKKEQSSSRGVRRIKAVLIKN